MKDYIEVRTLQASDLRRLCIEKDWYTCGTNAEYEHLLIDLAQNKENLTTLDIVKIAEDIQEHSTLEEGYDIESIAFEVLRACNSFIRKVKKQWQVFMVAGSVKHLFMSFDSEDDVERFCESNNYSWLDENEFCWDLEIEEVEE